MSKVKKKASELQEGDVFFIGKKQVVVRTVAVIPVPVTRNVDTAVITYSPLDDEDKDGEIIIDHHIAAAKKVDVLPPTKLEKFKSWFSRPKKKEEKEEKKIVPPSTPFFVKPRSP